ncbi:MAG: hypothetical protein QGG40_20550, partial [Myxococcota bacterium]|nr:hypothetical protein [Myxococcota bacterium]
MVRWAPPVGLLVLLVGCADAPVDESSQAQIPEEVVPTMSSVDLLSRASLDLRGVRPSIEEIEAVEVDPDA